LGGVEIKPRGLHPSLFAVDNIKEIEMKSPPNFDAVLNSDMKLILKGTPEEIRKWLIHSTPFASTASVCIGETMHLVSPKEYLNRACKHRPKNVEFDGEKWVCIDCFSETMD
jgi:hypothetical protein